MIPRRDFLSSALGIACATLSGASSLVAQDGDGVTAKTLSGASAAPLSKRDYRAQPFRTAVALGDSITAGSGATSRDFCWVSRLHVAVNESQTTPLSMVNSGLGANVISPRSAGYDHSGKPSAMERYGKHAVAYHPDLVILAYGVNDARAGTLVAQFLADLRHIVEDIQEKTGALILLSSTSFMTAFRQYSPFDHASIRIFESYNRGIKQVAEECDALYADIFSALAFAPWTVDPDGVHPNNLGHRLIADSVYSVLAANCSCLSQKAIELRKTFTPWQDGATLSPIS